MPWLEFSAVAFRSQTADVRRLTRGNDFARKMIQVGNK